MYVYRNSDFTTWIFFPLTFLPNINFSYQSHTSVYVIIMFMYFLDWYIIMYFDVFLLIMHWHLYNLHQNLLYMKLKAQSAPKAPSAVDYITKGNWKHKRSLCHSLYNKRIAGGVHSSIQLYNPNPEQVQHQPRHDY